MRDRATGDIEIEEKIRSLDGSAKVVERATGRKPPLDDPAMAERFSKLRAARAREEAERVFHWNAALRGMEEQAASRPDLRVHQRVLLGKAGFKDGIQASMPAAIEKYTRWELTGVTPVSKHSAVYSYKSSDRKRGTPHPRGRGRRPEMKTWHTTLLAEIGPNDEGPLPWIEREYTPVSSAKEWESGRVDLLVKVYAQGKATSWLHRESPPQVWLSAPVKTLNVPSLVAEGNSFAPQSVLLVLAGTGVVALPQILAHRSPIQQLGLSSHKRDQLQLPIDLVLSCREDDVLMLPQIAEWCGAGEAKGVRHCTLLLTASNSDPPIFPEAADGDAAAAERALGGLGNVSVVRSRLSPELLAQSVGRMPPPCRVVVSGPDGFNGAAREMLSELLDVDEQVTILSA